jgi:phenylpropionate dioxygenase-like ring-hydroxylating dioxygenase large terminal subunit
MARSAKRHPTSRLVDLQGGVVSREIFVNKAIYQQEQAQAFARTWLFVGHESQIPRSGDYSTSCMGEESVILTHDNREHIQVFLNTCRHRGTQEAYREQLDRSQ